MSPDTSSDVFDVLSQDHEEIRRALAALARLDTTAADAEPRLGEIISSGLEHMAEEERIWAQLRRVVGPEEARRLGRELRSARARNGRPARPVRPASGNDPPDADSAAAALDQLRKAAIECGDQ